MCLDSALFIEIRNSHKRFEIELKALLKDIDEGRIDIQFAYQQLAEIKNLMNKQKEKLKVLRQ